MGICSNEVKRVKFDSGEIPEEGSGKKKNQ